MTAITLSTNANTILGRTGLAIVGLVVFAIAVTSPGTNRTESPNGEPAKLDYPALGQHGSVSVSKLLGCVQIKEIEQYQLLLEEMDVPALDAFVRSHILTGQCKEIDRGVEVVVEQSPASDQFCVRPVDASDCLWTNKGWIRKMPSAGDVGA
jgi:hypothetical protein